MRGGSSKPTTAAGLNKFSWDLRYPGATVFDGMIIWSARPQRGPKATPGNYHVRIKAGELIETKAFEIEMDPNLKEITREDMEAQFDLAMKIRNKTSETNEAVIRIRKIKNQIEERMKGNTDLQFSDISGKLLDQLSAVEEELYQVKNQSNQDPLNFPIKLNNRFAYLRRSVENGNSKPTDGALKVFIELSGELERHLAILNEIFSSDLAKFNALLRENNIEELNMH
jgi:hypothetical protein